MPCVENFQALISVQGKYLEEFKVRRARGESGSASTADALVESPFHQPYKIIFGTINPQLQDTDLIAYVLVDGNLVASRIIRRCSQISSCQVSGMSLSPTGLGPVELADKIDGMHVAKNIPPVPGSIRILVYRGTAKETKEPSLFNYPTFVCPLYFVNNPRQKESKGLEHISGLGEPVPVNVPSETYTFQSSDPTKAPLVTIDFFYRSATQLSEQLNPSPVVNIPRSLPPPPPPPVTAARPRVKIEARPAHYRIIELGGGGGYGKDLQSVGYAEPYASSPRTEVSSKRASATPTPPSLPSPSASPATTTIAPLSFSYDSDISSYGLSSTTSSTTSSIISLPHSATGSTYASSSTSTALDPNFLHPLPSSIHHGNVFKNQDHYQQHQSPSSSSSSNPNSSSVLRPLFTHEVLAPVATRRSPLGSRTANFVPQMEIQASEMSKKEKPAARRGGVSGGRQHRHQHQHQQHQQQQQQKVKSEEQEQVGLGLGLGGPLIDQQQGGKVEREERASKRAKPYPASSVGARTGGRGR